MRFRATSLAALAAVPLALSACGTAPAPEPAPAPPPAAGPEGIEWAGRLCGLVNDFSASQKNLPAVDKANTEAMKNSVVARLDTATKTADGTVRGLQELPPSPIEGGDQVSQGIADGFVQIRDVLEGARAKADQVDPNDKQKFTEGMTALQGELQKTSQVDLNSKFGALEKNPQLAEAAKKAPGCQPFFNPAPAQPAPGQPAPAPAQPG
ncbi:hypothetical protein EIL87_10505 [Saccharopolyspora rhizosphaerae]|uniref:Small secreted protein n=1 Tax=Saccharopolyspora rhizosphaerae TaxID=2492662 RepID=A0A426JVX0_9PSEU|nr:hypothetical protein [Saccharopolyspora rhizosphaerae]RRO17231.1 hypothetical protein EIL87_10505 [Saccharopolyspora rhizosphaerae]